MKNLSTIIAIACAMLVVACGGEQKPKEEPVVRVVSKAKVLVDKLIACGDDTLKQKEVWSEIDSCRNSLMLSEQERFDKMIIEFINNDRRNKRDARLGLTQEQGDEWAQDAAKGSTIQLVYYEDVE